MKTVVVNIEFQVEMVYGLIPYLFNIRKIPQFCFQVFLMHAHLILQSKISTFPILIRRF